MGVCGSGAKSRRVPVGTGVADAHATTPHAKLPVRPISPPEHDVPAVSPGSSKGASPQSREPTLPQRPLSLRPPTSSTALTSSVTQRREDTAVSLTTPALINVPDVIDAESRDSNSSPSPVPPPSPDRLAEAGLPGPDEQWLLDCVADLEKDLHQLRTVVSGGGRGDVAGRCAAAAEERAERAQRRAAAAVELSSTARQRASSPTHEGGGLDQARVALEATFRRALHMVESLRDSLLPQVALPNGCATRRFDWNPSEAVPTASPLQPVEFLRTSAQSSFEEGVRKALPVPDKETYVCTLPGAEEGVLTTEPLEVTRRLRLSPEEAGKKRGFEHVTADSAIAAVRRFLPYSQTPNTALYCTDSLFGRPGSDPQWHQFLYNLHIELLRQRGAPKERISFRASQRRASALRALPPGSVFSLRTPCSSALHLRQVAPFLYRRRRTLRGSILLINSTTAVDVTGSDAPAGHGELVHLAGTVLRTACRPLPRAAVAAVSTALRADLSSVDLVCVQEHRLSNWMDVVDALEPDEQLRNAAALAYIRASCLEGDVGLDARRGGTLDRLPSARGNGGATILHAAAREARNVTVLRLFTVGLPPAAVNVPDSQGATCLQYAAELPDNGEAVAHLLLKGADVSALPHPISESMLAAAVHYNVDPATLAACAEAAAAAVAASVAAAARAACPAAVVAAALVICSRNVRRKKSRLDVGGVAKAAAAIGSSAVRSSAVTCPRQQHRLIDTTGVSTGWWGWACDHCWQLFEERGRTERWTCLSCDYDLCQSCHAALSKRRLFHQAVIAAVTSSTARATAADALQILRDKAGSWEALDFTHVITAAVRTPGCDRALLLQLHKLLRMGKFPEATAMRGAAAAAVEAGQSQLLSDLREIGCCLHAGSRNPDIPQAAALFVAARKGDVPAIQTLRAADADMRVQCQSSADRFTALHVAAEEGRDEAVVELCSGERPCMVDAADASMRTPLHVAAFADKAGCVTALLLQGADVHARDENERTPSHHAADQGSAEALRALRGGGGGGGGRRRTLRVGDPDSVGLTPLHLAARGGHVDATAELLRDSLAGDGKAVDAEGRTALALAAAHGRRTVVSLLLRSGSDPNATDNEHQTTLHLAAAHGDPVVVRALLDAGAFVNAKTLSCRSTPLHRAASRGHVEVARLLLSAPGCEVEPVDAKGQTPLNAAESTWEPGRITERQKVADLLRTAGPTEEPFFLK